MKSGPLAATWMDLEIIISKVNQTEKDKYLMISLIGRILKEMIQMNLFTKRNSLSELENEFMVIRRSGGEG